MLNDPIVQAVRHVREELAAEFGYDVHQIFADMRERESQFGDRLIQQPVSRRPFEPFKPQAIDKVTDGEITSPSLG